MPPGSGYCGTVPAGPRDLRDGSPYLRWAAKVKETANRCSIAAATRPPSPGWYADSGGRSRCPRGGRSPSGPPPGMAHQLIDHPGRDAGILQPGREGMPQVVRASQPQLPKQVVPG